MNQKDKPLWSLLKFFPFGSDQVSSVCFGKKSGKLVGVGGSDGNVSLFQLVRVEEQQEESDSPFKMKLIRTLEGHKNHVSSVYLTNSEDKLLAGSDGGSIRLWNLNRKSSSSKIFSPGHRASVTVIREHPIYADYIATASVDTNIKVWDITKRKCVREFRKHSSEITAMEFTKNHTWLISGDKKGRIYIWDIKTGKLKKKMEMGHVGAVLTIFIHPTHMLMASGGADKMAIVWEFEKFKKVCTTPMGTQKITHISIVKPDNDQGEVLVSCSLDSVKIWSLVGLEIIDMVDAKFSGEGIEDTLLVKNEKENYLMGISKKKNTVQLWNINLSKLAPFASEKWMKQQKRTLTQRNSSSNFEINTFFGGQGANTTTTTTNEKKINEIDGGTHQKNIEISYKKPPSRKGMTKKLMKDTLLHMANDNQTICSILSNRFFSFRLYKELWFQNEDTRRECLKQLIKEKDLSLVKDVLDCIFSNEESIRYISTELIGDMFLLLNRMLESIAEEHIRMGIRHGSKLFRKQKQLIKDVMGGEKKNKNFETVKRGINLSKESLVRLISMRIPEDMKQDAKHFHSLLDKKF